MSAQKCLFWGMSPNLHGSVTTRVCLLAIALCNYWLANYVRMPNRVQKKVNEVTSGLKITKCNEENNRKKHRDNRSPPTQRYRRERINY